MNGGPSLAGAVPGLAGAAMLLLGLFLPTRRRRVAAARLVAWQGAFLALAAAASAAAGEAAAPFLWFLAFGALAGRALLLPALVRAAAGVGPDGEARPRAARALLLGGALAVLAAAAVFPAAGAAAAPGAREGLALALAVLLAGLLAMASGRGIGSGLLGLLAAENGALLGLVHAGAALPGAAALAVLSPGLLAGAALAARGGARGYGGASNGRPAEDAPR